MTPKQKEQFNSMCAALRRIATEYQTPEQLRENAEKEYGIDGDEAIDYAYENMQMDAARTVAGVRMLK